MFFFKENRKNSFRKENNDNLDPFFDYKKKARHRLVGSIIFAILIGPVVALFLQLTDRIWGTNETIS